MPLYCYAAENDGTAVEFSIPERALEKGKLEGVKIFNDLDNWYKHFIKISCLDLTSINSCRDHGYEVEVIYDVMYPSGVNGTDTVTKIMKESYSIQEAFKLSIRL